MQSEEQYPQKKYEILYVTNVFNIDSQTLFKFEKVPSNAQLYKGKILKNYQNVNVIHSLSNLHPPILLSDKVVLPLAQQCIVTYSLQNQVPIIHEVNEYKKFIFVGVLYLNTQLKFIIKCCNPKHGQLYADYETKAVIQNLIKFQASFQKFKKLLKNPHKRNIDKINLQIKQNRFKIRGQFKEWPKKSSLPIGVIKNILPFHHKRDQQLIFEEYQLSNQTYTQIDSKNDAKFQQQFFKFCQVQTQIKNRKTIQQRVFTLDSLNCQRYDDAISIGVYQKDKQLKTYRLGLHVCDLDEYIPYYTKYNEQIRKRDSYPQCTSVKTLLFDYGMSIKLFSLNKNKQKVTISMIIDVESSGNINFNSVQFNTTCVRISENYDETISRQIDKRLSDFYDFFDYVLKKSLIFTGKQTRTENNQQFNNYAIKFILQLGAKIPAFLWKQVNQSRSASIKKQTDKMLQKILDRIQECLIRCNKQINQKDLQQKLMNIKQNKKIKNKKIKQIQTQAQAQAQAQKICRMPQKKLKQQQQVIKQLLFQSEVNSQKQQQKQNKKYPRWQIQQAFRYLVQVFFILQIQIKWENLQQIKQKFYQAKNLKTILHISSYMSLVQARNTPYFKQIVQLILQYKMQILKQTQQKYKIIKKSNQISFQKNKINPQKKTINYYQYEQYINSLDKPKQIQVSLYEFWKKINSTLSQNDVYSLGFENGKKLGVKKQYQHLFFKLASTAPQELVKQKIIIGIGDRPARFQLLNINQIRRLEKQYLKHFTVGIWRTISLKNINKEIYFQIQRTYKSKAIQLFNHALEQTQNLDQSQKGHKIFQIAVQQLIFQIDNLNVLLMNGYIIKQIRQLITKHFVKLRDKSSNNTQSQKIITNRYNMRRMHKNNNYAQTCTPLKDKQMDKSIQYRYQDKRKQKKQKIEKSQQKLQQQIFGQQERQKVLSIIKQYQVQYELVKWIVNKNKNIKNKTLYRYSSYSHLCNLKMNVEKKYEKLQKYAYFSKFSNQLKQDYQVNQNKLEQFLTKNIKLQSSELIDNKNINYKFANFFIIQTPQLKWNNPMILFSSLQTLRLLKYHPWIFNGRVKLLDYISDLCGIKQVQQQINEIESLKIKKIPTKHNFPQYEALDWRLKQLKLFNQIQKNNGVLKKQPVLCVISQKDPKTRFIYLPQYGQIQIEPSQLANLKQEKLFKKINVNLKIKGQRIIASVCEIQKNELEYSK